MGNTGPLRGAPARLYADASNLHDWPGADVAYRRAQVWTQRMANEAWADWSRLVAARKRRRRPFQFPEDAAAMIDAMNVGDEETMKALNLRHIDKWIDTEPAPRATPARKGPNHETPVSAGVGL